MVHEAADDADWKHNRLTTQQFLKRQMETGRRISPIFSVFGVETYLFRVGWLHSADQGVGADLAGNVFEELLPKLPGASKQDKCHALNEKLQAWLAEWKRTVVMSKVPEDGGRVLRRAET